MREPPRKHLARSCGRGAVSRAASALMFALAGVAAFVFPEGEAGAISAAGGFAPAQVPTGDVLPATYRNPTLCTDLGGNLQEVDGEWVCSDIDRAGTFCIVGSTDIFPCRGLFRRAIECNNAYNRPLVNPFVCGLSCNNITGHPWAAKARGPNCEFNIPAAQIIAEEDQTVTLPGNFPDGYTGVLATLRVSLLTFQGEEYESHTLINDRPLGPGVSEANADQLTISAGNVLGIPEYAPLRTGEEQRVIRAKNSCPEIPGRSFNDFADMECYPVYVNITANFLQPVVPRTDIHLPSVAANIPAAVTLIKVADKYSGPGYNLSLQNTADYALSAAYDSAVHGFDADNGIILIDRPIQAGAPVVATVAADVACRTIPFCNPLTISANVVFEPVAAPRQQDTSLPLTTPSFFLNLAVALPGDGFEYVASPVFLPPGHPDGNRFIGNDDPRYANSELAVLELAGVSGYDGDFSSVFTLTDGLIENRDSDGNPTALTTGDYVFTVFMTASDLVGTLSLEVPLNLYPENQIPPTQSIPPNERNIIQAIAPGYSGSIAFFQAAVSIVGLSTPGTDPVDAPFTVMAEDVGVTVFPPDGIVLHYTPDPNNPPASGETQVLTLSLRSEKMPGSSAIEEDFLVTVTVSIVSVPPQEPLETDDAEDFMHPLVVPGFDLSDGNFIVVSVINTDTNDNSVLGLGIFAVSNGILQRSREIGESPPPGTYDIVVEMTDHPDIRGTLTLTIQVVVRGFLNPATYNLSFPSAPILVAPGYDGNLRLQAPANISLSAPADATDALVNLPDSFPVGVSLELSDSREVVPHLTDPLAAGAELLAVLSLTIARADEIYAPIGQLVTLAISALALPPVVAADAIVFAPADIFAAGGDVIDLAAVGYENGAYGGADFRESGDSPELGVNLAGVVTSAVDLDIGEYEIIVVALGRPAASGARFLGEAEITVSVRVTQGAETIAPDDVVPAAAREAAIDAAIGYAGAGYAIPVGDGYELIQESWDENVFGYDADGEVILITTAVGDDPLSYVVDAEARCAGASGRLCNTIDITVTATFNPVRAPSQTDIPAAYLDSFAGEISFPSGYEDGGPKSAGRALVVTAVEGWTGDIAALSLSFSGGTLTYAPGDAAANALTPGDYTVAFEMTQTDLLGTVAFEVAANISPAPLDAAEYGLSEIAPVTIVPGPGGVGLSVGGATLTGVAAGASVALPATFPASVSLALNADGRGFAVYISEEFAGEAEADIRVSVTVALPDANYAPLQVVVPVAISVLPQPALIERSATSAPYTSGNIADLKTGVFAGATFSLVAEGSDAGLTVDEDGIVSTDAPLNPGTYDIVVAATSPGDFFGAARITLRLVVNDRPILTPAQTVPSGQRSQAIPAVAGYAGSVAFFVASNAGVTLQTPATAPAGFNFGGADGLNADFVSPEGFTLFLEADQIPNDGDAAPADFEVVAQLDGFENEDITLNITVVAIAAPPQDAVNAAFLDGFVHALNLPPGYESGVVGRNLAVSGVGGRTDGAANLSLVISGDSLEYAPGGGEDDTLAAGQYIVTVAMTQRDLLGTMYLEVPAEIAPRALEAEYALSDLSPERITVAAGYDGALYEVSLSAVSAVIALPSAYPEGFAAALSPDSRRATLLSDSALDGGLERAGTIALTVVRVGPNGEADANYAPLAQPLPLTALALPALATVSLAGLATEFAPYANPLIYDFRAELGGAYAEANFGKEGGAAELTISSEGVVSTFSDIASPGLYTLAATASAATYLGAARAALELSLFSREFPVSYSSLPADGARGTLTVSGLASGETALFGATVTFVAAPAEFNYVAEWSSPRCAPGVRFVSESAECALVATTAISLSAEFRTVSRRIELSLASAFGELSAASGGSVLVSGADVPHGTAVTFTAAPQRTERTGGDDLRFHYVSAWTREPFGGGDAEPVCETEIGGPSDTTPKTCALTADRGMRIAADFDLARERLDARLTMAILGETPIDLELAGLLLTLGADADQTDADGRPLLIRAAQDEAAGGRPQAVSILIAAGADPDALTPGVNRQVPHWATRLLLPELLRHYIAAIGQVGHSYDWNGANPPLDALQQFNGSNRSAAALEVAALIYERGGRCRNASGYHCSTIPLEEPNPVIADAARGDVFTIVARDLGAAEFDLSLPETDALTALASIGWTLRLETERPQRIVLARGETTATMAAVFTITAQYGGADVRHYRVSARVFKTPSAELFAELSKATPDASWVAELFRQGATLAPTQTDEAGALMIRAARDNNPPLVSVLITAGADADARSPGTNRQVPHWAARDVRLEVLRHYIAAIGQVGHSYDWNDASDAGPPLDILQNFHGSDESEATREVAALIYERGGRCGALSGYYCDTIPFEERAPVIADDARGDVFTIVARDFGAAEFTLSLPEANALTVLASIGWTLRLDAAERPQRVVLERGETTSRRAAIFTITAQYGGADVRRHIVSARLESAAADPDAALAAAVVEDPPDSARIADLLNQGADVNQTDDDGEALLLRVARAGEHLAVSILIAAGADADARSPGTDRQVPHWAARELRLEVLRHYIAAIGQVGHSYDWNSLSNLLTPLAALQNIHGGDRGAEAREVAALIYERGGRCDGSTSGYYCNTIPFEVRSTVIADAARGGIFTIVARDLGAAEFTLSLPEADALTVLASIGWTLRLEAAARPQRAILERGETTSNLAAVFTITARHGGADARHYRVSAGLESAEAAGRDAELAAEIAKNTPDLARVAELFSRGATLAPVQADDAGAVMLLAAQADDHLLVSVLVTAGANPDARSPGVNRQVPHWAAREVRRLEVLRHYIAAIAQVGHSYDWNSLSEIGGDLTPLDIVQNRHGGDQGAAAREIAALIYERGGECNSESGFYCAIPLEERAPAVAPDARGDILTIVARDFGAAEFDLPLPEANALTILASIGWTLRLETERPQRVVLERGETTSRRAAVFTITAQYGGADARRYIVSARVENAAADAALAAELSKADPEGARVIELLGQGATLAPAQAAAAEALMLQAAIDDDYALVSVLITAGANPDARSPGTNRQVPHWAARLVSPELLRHYIAAIGQVGHSYDWNDGSTPLAALQLFNGSDRSAAAREVAALIYERGGRCGGASGYHCDTIPFEERNPVVDADARGDVFTIVARDFGTAEFDLSPPDADALTALASIGWTLRLETERPRRIVLAQGETAAPGTAVFTITAQYGGADARHYRVSARVYAPSAELFAELSKATPDAARVAELFSQGATLAPAQADEAGALMLQAARDNNPPLVSVLITAGADADARSPGTNRQVPHWAAREVRLEVLRHYIAAIGQVGHSYDWNDASDAGPPLDILQNFHGSDESEATREVAALIYERGGRCGALSGYYCDTIPFEERAPVIADAARGDVFTIVARDFGTAEFTLSLPEANALTVLASIGWTLRLEAAARPQQVVLERGETTSRRAAVFTITAQYGGADVRRHIVSARLESAAADPDAALAAEVVKDAPDFARIADLLNQGADVNQTDDDGEALLLQVAQAGEHSAVSILITLGAEPDARSPANNYQVPHWAAREVLPDVLRHYIAAVGRVGRSYDWNDASDDGSPLEVLQTYHGGNRSEEAREVAALIYERGGRCGGASGYHCDTIPFGERAPVIADDARGDVFTIVARDFGAAEFTLSLPEANALTVLASIGWTLRLEAAARPQRVVLERGETASKLAAVFTITAQYGGADVRRHIVSARLESAAADPDAALAAEVVKDAPDFARIADLLENQGANVNQTDDSGEALLLRMARAGEHLAVSVLITLGADADARDNSNRQVPHWAAQLLLPEVLRHYIAAIGQVGHSYDWNSLNNDPLTPLAVVRNYHSSDRSEETLEVAALIYERGGRCDGSVITGGYHCDTIPFEERNTVIADDARGDILTIVARDLGAAEFDLPLPDADALAALANSGWTLRLETERPQRVVLERGETTAPAVFTITARNGGADVRHYRVSARTDNAAANAALFAELSKTNPDAARVMELFGQGATLAPVQTGAAEALMLQAARDDNYLLMSVLITAGANPDARDPAGNQQIPHLAARLVLPEVLRHYIAAIGQVGHSYVWNNVSDDGSPLEILQALHGSDRGEDAREVAALIYERGGRCRTAGGQHCDTVPLEERSPVIADDARGDVLTIVARDLGAAEFDLPLPEADALAALASIGWTLRSEAAARPQRVVLARGETTSRRAAVFTITVQRNGADVRHYIVSARLEGAAADPDAALFAEFSKADPDAARVAELFSQGATLATVQADAAETLMLQAAVDDNYLLVSVLITAGADPDARTPGTSGRQVPHWAAREFRPEVLRHYIAAVGQVGHSYDWNSLSDNNRFTPLDILQNWHGGNQDAEAREFAALIYERGGRCADRSGYHCDTIPFEEHNPMIADTTRGDVFTIVARDFGAAEFDLPLPETDALTALASVGWTLRLEAERPQRVVLERGETTQTESAVFTITARHGGADARHYRVSARVFFMADDPSAELAAELSKANPEAMWVTELFRQGATLAPAQADEAGALMIQAARDDDHLLVSVLVTAGANADARSAGNNRQVPHWAARDVRLEVLRHYIAAIAQVGHSYDWNDVSDAGPPLQILQTFHGGNQGAAAREVAALIYERGGRCGGGGYHCGVPFEKRNTVIADDARGDVLTIVARDFGAAEFTLSLPEADALTVLASIGWTLRLEASARPQRAILERGETTSKLAAVFTITAEYGGATVRHHIVSARLESDPDAALAAEIVKDAPDPARIAELLGQGANVNQTDDGGEALLLRMARAGEHLAVSILVASGADADARTPGLNRQVPHWAARDVRPEVLRHYIAAAGQVGHSYDWNSLSDNDALTPLSMLQSFNASDESEEAREVAALIYERGGRCGGAVASGYHCDTIPFEERAPVIADDARGDVFTIVARDFGAAEFTLSLPEADALAILAGAGWTLRADAAARPQRAILGRGETTSRRAAMFTITAQYGGADVRHYIVSARLESAAADPDAALFAELSKANPDAPRVADLFSQGATLATTQADAAATLMLQAAAFDDNHLLVSVLVTAGADADARSAGTNRQVPHWAAREIRLEVLRHYIAAIGQVGHSYDWNSRSDGNRLTPLDIVQNWHGSSADEEVREIAELIYERGGRCNTASGAYCDNVPLEERNLIVAGDATGDVFTIVARDFGAAEFDLPLPETDALTALASVGWTLRLETERPRRVVLERGETTLTASAVFTITARHNGEDARHYRVSARVYFAADDPSAELSAELSKANPEAMWVTELFRQGATLAPAQADEAGALMIQAARNDNHLLVSVLVTAGANADARSAGSNRQVPHWAARDVRLEVLRHYIAAIGQVGHSYDWNSSSDVGLPLVILQNFHGGNQGEEAREVAALIYERGGRCGGGGYHCGIPFEERNTVIADDARGDVLTIVARDFGAAEFTLSLPEADARTALASAGWTLRLDASARPRRAILGRGETTSKQAAAFTITAQYGGADVRRYIVSARLESAEADPDAALAAEVFKDPPDFARIADLLNQGATLGMEHADAAGTIMIQAATLNMHSAVSILITAGANPGTGDGDTSRQVPHWAARELRLEVLRNYIAAIGQVGYSYDWNAASDIGAPLEIVQAFHGGDRGEVAREVAALIYERGGRCSGGAGFYCDNVPSETRGTVIAEDARGDVLAVIARDFGAAVFDLLLPTADELTILADAGWTLRLETERPQRVALTRGETTRLAAAVFTITARGGGGADVRRHIISAGVAVDDPDAALAAELSMSTPDATRVAELFRQGATLAPAQADAAGALMLQAARDDNYLLVSVLVTAGANAGARTPGNSGRQVPHWAARDVRLEVLRHYIAAIGQVGHSYDWNVRSDSNRLTPLDIVQNWRGSDQSPETREVAELIYERGGRCHTTSGYHCATIPFEERNLIVAGDATGDVFTIVARDFGAAEFDLPLPETDALTILASIGWTLRLDAAERPQRVVLERGETTLTASAVFTITAQYGGEDARHYRVSARVFFAADDPSAELAAELSKAAPEVPWVAELFSQGATLAPVQADAAGTLMIQAARDDNYLLVSVLITAGANADARSSGSNRQVPHWAARDVRLEVLRHYIAAIGQVGRSYDWNDVSDAGSPLAILQNFHGSDEGEEAREVAALIYERGGRCGGGGYHCAIPFEERAPVIADDARGDVLTIVARDFGAAEFTLSLPEADARTALASAGWTLRVDAAARPQRAILERGETTSKRAAVFTITAQYGGADVRRYRVSARLESAEADPDAALAAEIVKDTPDFARVVELLDQGANANQTDDGGDALLLRMARNDNHLLVSVLITAGADADARSPGTSGRQVPHWAARDLRLEVLRHYIAAIGQVGHSYDWNVRSDNNRLTPLDIVQNWHGGNQSDSAREIVALIYERGGGCVVASGSYCDNVPTEERSTVIADDATGDVLAIVARDFGAAAFDLSLPTADELTVLASIGVSLRLETERPQRVVAARNSITMTAAAVFTITARNGGTDVRHYIVSVSVESASGFAPPIITPGKSAPDDLRTANFPENPDFRERTGNEAKTHHPPYHNFPRVPRIADAEHPSVAHHRRSASG